MDTLLQIKKSLGLGRSSSALGHRLAEQSAGASNLRPWLDALVWSHLIFLLHPCVCQGIYLVSVGMLAYS